jgi:hypothetical protein
MIVLYPQKNPYIQLDIDVKENTVVITNSKTDKCMVVIIDHIHMNNSVWNFQVEYLCLTDFERNFCEKIVKEQLLILI